MHDKLIRIRQIALIVFSQNYNTNNNMHIDICLFAIYSSYSIFSLFTRHYSIFFPYDIIRLILLKFDRFRRYDIIFLILFIQLLVKNKNAEAFSNSLQIRYVIRDLFYPVHLFLQEFSLQKVHEIRIIVRRSNPV